MKKTLFVAIVALFSFVFTSFAGVASAAVLVEDRQASAIELTSIVMEDFSDKNAIKTTDVGGLKTVAQVENLLRDVVPGKNVRFISSDPELLQSWFTVANSMGFKPKMKDKPELSQRTQKVLRRGQISSFEIKTIKGQKFGWREGLGVAGVIATAIGICR